MRGAGAVAQLAMLLFSAGCVHRTVHLPDLSGFHRAGDSERAVFSAAWASAQAQIRTGRIKSTVTVRGPLGRSASVRQVTIFNYPDMLRQQFFATNLNAPTFIVLVRSADFEAYDFGRREGFRGPVNLENARKLLAVPLYPEEWMFWLSGRLISPPPDDVLEQELFVDGSGDRFFYRLSLGDGRYFHAHFICGTKLLLGALEVGYLAEHEPIFVSNFTYGSSEHPTAITFDLPPQAVSGTVEIERAVFDKAFTGKEMEVLFTPRFPADARFHDLEDLPPDFFSLLAD